MHRSLDGKLTANPSSDIKTACRKRYSQSFVILPLSYVFVVYRM